MRIALIGATGLIGGKVADRLVGQEAVLVGRRPSGKPLREIVAPIAEWPAAIRGEAIDVVISALGTTIKQVGSWTAFEAVDRTAVVDVARAAHAAGARQMIMISSVGADPSSRFAYVAMKGRVERDLGAIGFERLDIVRPGLLLGERGGPRRTGEALAIALNPVLTPLLRGRLDRYAGIDADCVAAAVVALVGAAERGTFIHHNRDIRGLGNAR